MVLFVLGQTVIRHIVFWTLSTSFAAFFVWDCQSLQLFVWCRAFKARSPDIFDGAGPWGVSSHYVNIMTFRAIENPSNSADLPLWMNFLCVIPR
jgi:hypothetical protein